MIISVIIPAYNAEQTLSEMLRSVHLPSSHPVEIIVVDDGSEDQTAAIAEKAGAKVIRMHGNFGPSASRNRGAGEAGGELFVFADADVVLFPDTMEKIADTFQQCDVCDALVGNLTPTGSFTNSWSTYKNLYTHFSMRDSGPTLTHTFTSLTAVRPHAFWDAGGFPDIYPNEDRLFGIELARKGYRIRFDPELQVLHRRNYGFREFLWMEFQRSRNIVLITFETKRAKTGIFKEHIPVGFRRASMFVAGAIVCILFTFFVSPWFFPAFVLSLLAGAWTLRSFLGFIRMHKGRRFSWICFWILVLDLTVCLLGAGKGAVEFILGRPTGRAP